MAAAGMREGGRWGLAGREAGLRGHRSPTLRPGRLGGRLWVTPPAQLEESPHLVLTTTDKGLKDRR